MRRARERIRRHDLATPLRRSTWYARDFWWPRLPADVSLVSTGMRSASRACRTACATLAAPPSGGGKGATIRIAGVTAASLSSPVAAQPLHSRGHTLLEAHGTVSKNVECLLHRHGV